MKIVKTLLIVLFVALQMTVTGQSKSVQLTINVTVDEALRNSVKPDGRIYIHLSEQETSQPRRQSGINKGTYVFAKNISDWNSATALILNGTDEMIGSSKKTLNEIPAGTYFMQVLWDQNGEESRANVPGNIYSETKKISLETSQHMDAVLANIIPEREVVTHELVDMFTYKSEVLSAWWKKPMHVNASVLLPSGYHENPTKRYPVRYNVAGYGGRYTRINNLVKNKEFINWWTTKNAPQVITVFLDGEGPFGDSYQLDSDNSGPYGNALINELIPAIESEFRILNSPNTRFVDGCSTGGWVSLALQLYYPETFNGCWSYSPDPVSFYKMQLINIYEDDNAFYNKKGYLRPSRRNISGAPDFSIKKEVMSENVRGYSNDFTSSGGQWGAWNALYSPKGENGLPMPVFDPVSGKIDKEVAEHWKQYDLLKLVQHNWSTLGPKLKGKINIWMGDMDNYYLNNAMRDFDAYMKSTTSPTSDAIIEFSAMEGHCSKYSHKLILKEIQKKVGKMTP